MQKITIIGNIGKDAVEISGGRNEGREAWAFTVAHSESWTNRDGQKQEKTIWHSVVYNMRAGSKLPPYLKSGQKVYVEGKVEPDAYQNANGEFIAKLKVIAQYVELCGGQSEGNGGAQRQPAQQRQQPTATEVYQQHTPRQRNNPPQQQLGNDLGFEDKAPF